MNFNIVILFVEYVTSDRFFSCLEYRTYENIDPYPSPRYLSESAERLMPLEKTFP